MKLLRASCIALLSAQPALFAATLPVVLHASASIAQTQSAEAVGKVAQAITVRIEGATQGSGVLVKRDGNRYTVLSAWHVVSGQRAGEELDIYTPDGQRHQVEQGSIKRLGEVDLAVLTFKSSSSYEVAPLGDVKSVSSGSSIYVSGFPLPTSAVPTRVFRFLKGDVVANATVAIPNGYQLLYSNPTLPGMSGGAVLNSEGQLIGIHGQGETDSKMSEQEGVAVKTGTNQAVPIAYYSQFSAGDSVVASSSLATTADDYLAQANALVGEKGSEMEIVRLADQSLARRKSAQGYLYRGYAKYVLGNNSIKYSLSDNKEAFNYLKEAIADFGRAIEVAPQYHFAYFMRGAVRFDLDDRQGAIADFDRAISINPRYSAAYENRGRVKSALGDKRGAMADYEKSAVIRLQCEGATIWQWAGGDC